MATKIIPVVFLGFADKIISERSYPYSTTDFMNLSMNKAFSIFPQSLSGSECVFLLHRSFIKEFFSGCIDIIFKNKKTEDVLYRLSATALPPKSKSQRVKGLGMLEYVDWVPFIFRAEFTLAEPCILSISIKKKSSNRESWISDVLFTYSPARQLTAEDLYGLRSRLISFKKVSIKVACSSCQDSLKAYTGVAKDVELEKEGHVWQSDLKEMFICGCKKTKVPLKYLRESMHAFLFKEHSSAQNMKRTSIYSNEVVRDVVSRFLDLIVSGENENSVQRYIEENPIMLCNFNAKKLFKKPEILGKFQADFAVLDANDNLIFIEIERPNIKLFKKNGHPTADLTHAYEQVLDWLLEIRASKRQILERMDLEENEIKKISGFVIAGICDKEEKAFYIKHQQKNENNSIGFMSFDELATAVLNLSKSVRMRN